MNKIALALLAALILSACQTRQTRWTATAPSEPLVCLVWRPLSYASHHDTTASINDIRRNNLRRKAYCEDKV